MKNKQNQTGGRSRALYDDFLKAQRISNANMCNLYAVKNLDGYDEVQIFNEQTYLDCVAGFVEDELANVSLQKTFTPHHDKIISESIKMSSDPNYAGKSVVFLWDTSQKCLAYFCESDPRDISKKEVFLKKYLIPDMTHGRKNKT